VDVKRCEVSEGLKKRHGGRRGPADDEAELVDGLAGESEEDAGHDGLFCPKGTKFGHVVKNAEEGIDVAGIEQTAEGEQERLCLLPEVHIVSRRADDAIGELEELVRTSDVDITVEEVFSIALRMSDVLCRASSGMGYLPAFADGDQG
jgi:hypothetical protein